jgi:predicted permease
MRVRLKLDRLTQLLAESSLSQNHWAMKLGLSRGHWSEIVNGKHPYPSARSRERMLDAFGASLDELFTIEPGSGSGGATDFRMAIGPEYLVDQELRQGGMGAVYLARDHHLRTVAIKVISPEAVSGIGVNQFLKEIATIAHLQHPHILPLFDSGEAAGHPFYVMPYVRSGSLRDRLKQDTRLTVATTVGLVDRIAAALHHAHQHQILHCDVKPENILLDGDHPYVMDFGIARAIHTETFEWGVPRQLDLSAGTPAYVSPEQANGDRDLDGRSDLYSLACVVFEMLTGRPPFEGTTTQAIVARRFLGLAPDLRDYAPEVPVAVAAVIENAMELDRNKRPPTVLAFAERLRQAADGKSSLLASASVVSSRALARVKQRAGLHAPTGVTRMLRDLWQDLVLAGRGMRRSPGYALAVILTLGLALGANATMFGIVDRLLLRAPSHIVRPDEVHRVQVARWFQELREPAPSLSYPAFLDIRNRSQDLSQVAAVEFTDLSYGTGAEAREVKTVFASGQYFSLLGVRPEAGRFFGEEEDRLPSGVPVAVLGHAFWSSQFAADSSALGRSILLNGRSFEIIGVAPRGFTGTEIGQADIWVPFSAGAAAAGYGDSYPEERGSQFLQVFVRLRDGVPQARANEDIRRAYHEGHADMREYEAKAVASLAPLIAARNENLGNREGRVAFWLLGVAVIVLLIACANVANLMLARGVARRSEIAVRQALGVSRGRLFRQLMTESLLLALLGGLTGLLLAQVSSKVIRSVVLPDVIWGETTLDWRMLGVTAIATVVAAVLAGLFPLLRTARGDLAGTLHGSTRTTIGHSRRLRMGLLLAQTSLCTVLIIGAGLFVRSLNRVATLDLGFEPDSLLRIELDLGVTEMSDAEKAAFFRSAAERVKELPGVQSTALSIGAPFLTNYATGLRVPGLDTLPRLPGGGPYYFRVSAAFLETIGGRIVQGRGFSDQDDRPGAVPVTMLTSRMASALWPNQNALEKCIIIDDGACSQVVGVIADVNRQGIEEDPFMLYFVPLGAQPTEEVPQYLLVRTRGPVETQIEPIRRSLSQLRANLPYISIVPFREMIDRQAQSWRMGSAMFMIFGGLSLVIAAVGLYGVLSYSVTQRTHELGIRSAIGATPGHLRRMIIIGGLLAALAGVVIGALAAILLSRQVQVLLFQTSAKDPLVFAGAAALVLLIAALASAIPGIRATRIDPLRALRAE